MDRILLVYNYWDWKPLSILSLLIRVFTYGPNHAAILKDGQVHEMVGAGYRVTPYAEWASKANRKVLEFQPLVPLHLPAPGQPYGYLDLVQILFHIIRTKWLLIGQPWDGKAGTRLWSGVVCSEFVALALGREDAHILAPADLQHIPELKKVGEFTTRKSNG